MRISFQRIVDRAWPVALLIMVIFTPFVVRKTWQEKREK